MYSPETFKFSIVVSNIAVDSVALTETANKFNQSSSGLIHTAVGYNIGQLETLLGCINKHRYHCVL